MKQVRIGDIFTDADIKRAYALDLDPGAIERVIVRPLMDKINEVTGQENHARYWAYALIYALNQADNLAERSS